MSYVQPGVADVHTNVALTQYSLGFLQSVEGFVADRAFTRLSVPKKSNTFTTYDRGMFNRDEMQRRAAGTESSGMTYTVGSDTYLCERFALHIMIDDELRANADSQFRLDQEAVEILTRKSLINREVKWAADFFVTGAWTGEDAGVSGTPSGAQFKQWNDAASTPIEDIRTSITARHAATGFRPNTFTVGREVYDALLDHPDIVGRLDRGQTVGTAMVLRQNLAELFEVDEILVMDAIANTAVEGATNAHSFIGGKAALLTYKAPNPGLLTPTAGLTFAFDAMGGIGTSIKRMRFEERTSDRIEIETHYDQKQVAADLGHFFLTAVA